MKFKLNLKSGCFIFISIYFLVMTLFYFLAGEQLFYRNSRKSIESVEGQIATSEITSSNIVAQSFLCEMNRIEGFSIKIATFARVNTGYLKVRLIDETLGNMVIYENNLDVSTLEDSVFSYFALDRANDNVFGHQLRIELSSDLAVSGNAVAPWYNPTYHSENQQLFINNNPLEGTICFSTFGKDVVWTGPHYWYIITGFGILLVLYCLLMIWKEKKGKVSLGLTLIHILHKYRFLIKQLVSRDFKIKYKRSVLGAFWSFLNPLLTMSVQYVVFSLVFKADIENYPVYLLSGIVLFGFFQEATSLSIYAIIGNANLITKVYMPKYIYPVSKVLSSSVNLIISLIPLFIMAIFTGVTFTKAFLIIPYILVCIILFAIGFSFILSAAMVFFRDIQFIWSVLIMIWMYATPIFYPENILPKFMLTILKFNPIYYFVIFMRTIIIQGISPEPMTYLQCMIYALMSCFVGITIFRKVQDKFIFYI